MITWNRAMVLRSHFGICSYTDMSARDPKIPSPMGSTALVPPSRNIARIEKTIIAMILFSDFCSAKIS